MGIPHLTALLRPYAEPLEWHTLANDAGLLLDGPSLAYFMFHKCFSENLKTKTSFEAIPSYDAVASETIAWLDGLKDFGFIMYVCIHHINPDRSHSHFHQKADFL